MVSELTETEQKLYDFLIKGKYRTQKEITTAMDWSNHSSTYMYIDAMIKKEYGFLLNETLKTVRRNSTKSGYGLLKTIYTNVLVAIQLSVSIKETDYAYHATIRSEPRTLPARLN